ncbi:hypothetical protein TRVA0_001S01926 [Trichomonascus vanleenenianus]|uniref:uncharacterized protein n=1 Tax=Trichomonascus vanleenenianus TaxID=2268995 RepID=UPI003ECB1A27
MEKNEESKESGSSNKSGEKEGPRVDLFNPNGKCDPDWLDLDGLPEDVKRRYLEEIVHNDNDINETVRLSAWALSQHPDLKDEGVTLDIEEIPGRGRAVVLREIDEPHPANQANPENGEKKKVILGYI